MDGRVHRIAHVGVVCAAVAGIHLLGVVIPLFQQAVSVAVFVLLATFPDIDHKIPGLKHRGFSHTFFAAILVSAGLWYLTDFVLTGDAVAIDSMPHLPWYIAIAAFASYSLHIFEDMLTKGGGFAVRPFWPLDDDNMSIGILPSDSPLFSVFAWAIFCGGLVVFLDVFGIVPIDLGVVAWVEDTLAGV